MRSRILTAAALALAACATPNTDVEPRGATCGDYCNSSLTCQQNPIGRCRYCFQNACTQVLPAGIDDAGVDSNKEQTP